jgi:hypothetical protein
MAVNDLNEIVLINNLTEYVSVVPVNSHQHTVTDLVITGSSARVMAVDASNNILFINDI